MIVSVHQPQYLPWLGYFDKIYKSDLFVFLDNVQYKKREFQNRNKLRTKDGSMWLTVPVITKGKYTQKISEVEIENESDWRAQHLKSLEFNYSGTEYFDEYIDFFRKTYSREWAKLIELNVHIINYLLETLEIKTPVKFESSLDIITESTQRIIDICKRLGADTYLSGAGGKDYMDESLFEKEKIKLMYQNFEHPVYKQRFSPFEPYMSVVDLLFNCGKESILLCTKNTGN